MHIMFYPYLELFISSLDTPRLYCIFILVKSWLESVAACPQAQQKDDEGMKMSDALMVQSDTACSQAQQKDDEGMKMSDALMDSDVEGSCMSGELILVT
jgi:hypothetical protein